MNNKEEGIKIGLVIVLFMGLIALILHYAVEYKYKNCEKETYSARITEKYYQPPVYGFFDQEEWRFRYSFDNGNVEWSQTSYKIGQEITFTRCIGSTGQEI